MTTYRVRISGILGSKSSYPCPICLVPKDKQSDLGRTWPARTKEGTDALITQASWQKTKEARKNTLASQSLRYIFVRGFLIFRQTSVNHALAHPHIEYIPCDVLDVVCYIQSIYIRSPSCHRAR